MGRWSRAVAPAFLDWVAPPSGARWLEVGCGTGVFTELVVDTCAPAMVSAVDPSSAQIDHARRQPVARRVDFRVGDAQALPFADGAFDVVAAALVINFIPDRPRALGEMRRVARAGGIVAGYVWDFAAERSPSGPLRVGMRQFGTDVPELPGTRDSSLRRARLAVSGGGFRKRRHPVHRGDAAVFQLRRLLAGADAQLLPHHQDHRCNDDERVREIEGDGAGRTAGSRGRRDRVFRARPRDSGTRAGLSISGIDPRQEPHRVRRRATLPSSA